MAVRFYLSNAASPVTLTADTTGWEATSPNRVVRAMSLTPGGSTASVSGTYSSPVSGTEMRLASFVSPPARRSFVLPSDADTGAFLITFAGNRASGGANVFGYFRYWVVSGNGGTFRGTFGAAVNTSAWGTTTGTLALRITPAGALPVTVQVGDRIVIDIGFRVTNTTTSTGVVYYGGTGSNPDMQPADTGTTAQNRPAWVEWEGLTFEDFSEPQRLYITNTTPALTADHPASVWDKTADVVSRALAQAPAGPPASVASIETSTSGAYDVLLGQWVSPPLVGSGSFTGGYRLVHGRQESAANANFQSRILLYVVEPDGTVRGVVHNGSTTGTAAEWPTSASAETLFGGNTRVDYQDEDRVVLELGYLAENTVNTSYTGTAYYGGTDSPDLESGDTDLDRPGWVNLPEWLVFGSDAAEIEGTAQASLGALTAHAAGTVTAEVVTATAQATLGSLSAQALGTVIAEIVPGTAQAQLGALSAQTLGTVTAEVIEGTAQAQLGTLAATANGTVTAELVTATAQAILGQLAASALGTVTVEVVQATAQALLGTLSASATGNVDVTAQATATLGELQTTALGTVTAEVVTGTAQATLGGLAAQALGEGTAEVVSGTAQALLGALAAQALGSVTAEVVTATATAQLGTLAASATSTRSTTGTASADLGTLVAQALGTVTAEVVPGQAAAVLGSLAAQATANVAVTATAQADLGGLAAQANATGASTGTAQALLGDLVATADGTVTAEVVTGAATALLGVLLAAATATGSSAGTAQAVLGALTASAFGDVSHTGTGTAQLGTLTAQALGESQAEVVPGAAQAELGALVSTATGSGQAPTITGTAQAQLGGLTAQALADVLVPALAAAQLGGLLATSSGRRTRHGFAQAVLGPLVATVLVTPPVVFAEMHPATVPAPVAAGAARSGPTMKGA